jgi:hypothetical protein
MIKVELDPTSERRRRFDKGRLLPRSRAVVQLPRSAQGIESPNHRPNWRDTDATGDQDDMRRRFDQRKIVARLADPQLGPDAQHFMYVSRAPTARRIPADGHHVPIPLALWIDQRIAPHEAIGKMHINMGAGRKGGQLTSIDQSKVEGVDPLRLVSDCENAHLNRQDLASVPDGTLTER